jgi:hypothetical protein
MYYTEANESIPGCHTPNSECVVDPVNCPPPVGECILQFSSTPVIGFGSTSSVNISNIGDSAQEVTLTSSDPGIVTICNSSTSPCPAGQASWTYNPYQYQFNATGVAAGGPINLTVTGQESE